MLVKWLFFRHSGNIRVEHLMMENTGIGKDDVMTVLHCCKHNNYLL